MSMVKFNWLTTQNVIFLTGYECQSIGSFAVITQLVWCMNEIHM